MMPATDSEATTSLSGPRVLAGRGMAVLQVLLVLSVIGFWGAVLSLGYLQVGDSHIHSEDGVYRLPPAGWVLVALSGLGLIASGWYPLASTCVVLACSAFVHRYLPHYEVFLRSGIMEWATAFGMMGMVRSRVKGSTRYQLPKWGLVGWLLVALVSWSLLVSLAAWFRDPDGQVLLKTLPRHGLVLLGQFVLVASCLRSREDWLLLTVVVGIALVCRILAWPESIELSSDLSIRLALALPLLLSLLALVPPWVWTILLPWSFWFCWVLLSTKNRASLVGIFAAGASGWLFARPRKIWLCLCLSAAAVLGGAIVVSPAWSRFSDLWEHGRARGTAEQRLDIWDVTLREVPANWLTGVGIGRSVYLLEREYPELGGLEVHNSYLAMLLETGVVGLGLYVALLLAAIGRLVRLAGRWEQRWRNWACWATGCVLIAYCAIGCFTGRQSLPLPFALMGLAGRDPGGSSAWQGISCADGDRPQFPPTLPQR